jgi:hypothetical protein
MDEIGRLREEAFRELGEGSKLSRDLDDFDKWYEHIILWDKRHNEIAGGCRIAQSDQILPRYGTRGFYSDTLFHYDIDFFNWLKYPAIDWGRVFVSNKYQKQSMVWQYLIWKGLLHVIHTHAPCRYVFGCCCISNEYSQLAKEILLGYCFKYRSEPELISYVHPHNPFNHDINIPEELVTGILNRINSIEDLSKVIEIIENGKPIPALLSTYLGFGAMAFCCVDDPDFNTVDAGVVLDMLSLNKYKPKLMQKLMENGNYERYLRSFSTESIKKAA